jgi:hypothetical protein
MTRRGPRKRVDDRYWIGRRDSARDFHSAARVAMDVARSSDNCAPAVSNMVNAAIAYADAIAASKLGVVNQQDHQAAPRLRLRALG